MHILQLDEFSQGGFFIVSSYETEELLPNVSVRCHCIAKSTQNMPIRYPRRICFDWQSKGECNKRVSKYARNYTRSGKRREIIMTW